MKHLQSLKDVSSLLTLPLRAGDRLVKRQFGIEGKTEIFETVDNLNTLTVHFHWLKNMIATSWIDDYKTPWSWTFSVKGSWSHTIGKSCQQCLGKPARSCHQTRDLACHQTRYSFPKRTYLHSRGPHCLKVSDIFTALLKSLSWNRLAQSTQKRE